MLFQGTPLATEENMFFFEEFLVRMEVVTTLLASNIFPENCSFQDGSPFFSKGGIC